MLQSLRMLKCSFCFDIDSHFANAVHFAGVVFVKIISCTFCKCCFALSPHSATTGHFLYQVKLSCWALPGSMGVYARLLLPRHMPGHVDGPTDFIPKFVGFFSSDRSFMFPLTCRSQEEEGYLKIIADPSAPQMCCVILETIQTVNLLRGLLDYVIG